MASYFEILDLISPGRPEVELLGLVLSLMTLALSLAIRSAKEVVILGGSGLRGF